MTERDKGFSPRERTRGLRHRSPSYAEYRRKWLALYGAQKTSGQQHAFTWIHGFAPKNRLRYWAGEIHDRLFPNNE